MRGSWTDGHRAVCACNAFTGSSPSSCLSKDLFLFAHTTRLSPLPRPFSLSDFSFSPLDPASKSGKGASRAILSSK